MKSYNHLFEKLIDHENLYNAILNASKNKRKRPEVKKVLAKVNRYIYRLQDIINAGKLKIRKHNAILINDGIHLKKRLIIKPDFVFEQILHHAIVQVLKPIFMKSMYVWSCGSLPKRGGVYGKKYLAKYIKNNPKAIKYTAKGDIHHIFQSIDTEILKKMLSKKIHDKRFLDVLFVVIDSNIAIYENKEICMGLPIGYYISQWLANWILTPIDYAIKQILKIKCYVRYVDDFVMLAANKKTLRKALLAVMGFLEKLKLKIKSNYQVYRFIYEKNGIEKGRVIDFMGFKFYRNRTVLRKAIMLKATRKAEKLSRKKILNWFECSQILSYLGWFKHVNVYKVYENYIKPKINVGDCKKVVSLHDYRKRRKENARLAHGRKLCNAA